MSISTSFAAPRIIKCCATVGLPGSKMALCSISLSSISSPIPCISNMPDHGRMPWCCTPTIDCKLRQPLRLKNTFVDSSIQPAAESADEASERLEDTGAVSIGREHGS